MSFEAGFREGVARGPSPCRSSQLINVRSSKTHSAHISGGGALKLSERGGRNAKKRAVVAASDHRSSKTAEGRMATEAARLKSWDPQIGRQNRLDSDRPSHGRS